ncbi:MAG: hypothetical protein V1676_04355 [Candidatus Diapherotrites archaeon]
MKMKYGAGIALLLAAAVLLGTYAFAEEALPNHEDANATAHEQDGGASIGADTVADNTGEIAEDTAADNGTGDAAAKAMRERARIAAEEAKQAREKAGKGKEAKGTDAETVSAEPADYETVLAQIGEGLNTEDAKNLGEIMSELAHRQAQERQDANLTGRERAEFNKQLNAYLKNLRADIRVAVKDKNLSAVVAREIARRAEVARVKSAAELRPEVLLEEISAVFGTADEAQLKEIKDIVRQRIRNNIHFWNRLLYRLKNDAKFRQHFRDMVHKWYQKQYLNQHPEIVRPEAATENVAARAINHDFVRQHLLEKIRQRLRDRAHNAKQASIIPELVQDMVDENAIINPALVQVDSAAVAAEVNPEAEINPAVAQPR